ncbi:MAG TPA: DUF4232 domain-containing protein [Gaiellaceae bacterium]|jgi:hypothetical protein
MLAPPRPPSHDELELLIKEARERQLRRRLLGAAAVAMAAALGLGAYAITIGGNVGNEGRTPMQGGRASVTFCRSSQLAMSIGGQGATEMVLGGALITNTGGQTCALPTRRPVVRITWQGKPMQVRQPVPRPGEVDSGTPAHVLARGAKALISMRWGNWCGRRASGLPTFRLLFGHGVTLSAPGLGVPLCIGPGMPGFLDVSRPLAAH